VSGKDQQDSDPWWDGRQVAIRPDVPGTAVDPGDLVLIKNDTERLQVQAGIDRSVDETKKKSSAELWPQWLWDADDDGAASSRDDEAGPG